MAHVCPLVIFLNLPHWSRDITRSVTQGLVNMLEQGLKRMVSTWMTMCELGSGEVFLGDKTKGKFDVQQHAIKNIPEAVNLR